MSRRIRTLLSSLPVLALAAACQGDAAGRDALTVMRDSAGITIVENPSPDDSASNVWWRVGAPTLSIGGLDAEEPYALFRVTDAIRLNDGRIVVSSSGSDDIRFFDATGTHVRTSGRTGGGPGEYQNPNGLMRGRADSLLVVDGTARRVSVLDPDGEFVRLLDITETASITRVVGRFEDGSLLTAPVVVLEETPGPDNDEISRPPFTLVRIPTDGGAPTGGESAADAPDRANAAAAPDTLGAFPGAERVMRVAQSGGEIVSISIMRPAFAKEPTFAVYRDEVYVGAQDGDEIRVHDRAGALVRIIRTGRAPEPVTDAHLAAHFERMLEAMPEEMRRQREAESRRNDDPHGEFVPAYGEIGIDLSGNLWVSDYDDPTGPAGRWTIYDPDGRVLARIALPERFQPYDAGDGWVLGREMDELDVEYVRLYEIVR